TGDDTISVIFSDNEHKVTLGSSPRSVVQFSHFTTMLLKSQGGNDDVTANISSDVNIPAITLDGSDGSDTLSSQVDNTTWNLTDSGSGTLQSPVGTIATLTVNFFSFEHIDAGKSKTKGRI